MPRININEFGAQAGGFAYRANRVRTDPAVVKAAKDAWDDVKEARHSCAVLGREASAAWQRTGTTEAPYADDRQHRTEVVSSSAEEQSVSTL